MDCRHDLRRGFRRRFAGHFKCCPFLKIVHQFGCALGIEPALLGDHRAKSFRQPTDQTVAQHRRQIIARKQSAAQTRILSVPLNHAGQGRTGNLRAGICKQGQAAGHAADLGDRSSQRHADFLAPGNCDTVAFLTRAAHVDQPAFAECRALRENRGGDVANILAQGMQDHLRRVNAVCKSLGKRLAHTRRWIVQHRKHCRNHLLALVAIKFLFKEKPRQGAHDLGALGHSPLLQP